MKFIVIFYLLFIVTFTVSSVFSYTSEKTHLHNLFRRPLRSEADSSVLAIQNDKDASATFLDQPSNSNEDEDNIQVRNNWDSGEDYYFRWAIQNRRPVEYLTGRKREADKMIIPLRTRHISGGLWRSGLVG